MIEDVEMKFATYNGRFIKGTKIEFLKDQNRVVTQNSDLINNEEVFDISKAR